MIASGGTTATSSAIAHTMGVYTFAKRVMKVSCFAFFSLASSTSLSILLAVDSPNGFVVRTVISPSTAMEPDFISSPARQYRGSLSPVIAEEST